MSEFNFKSQICTDRFQSERLLALGLKKETADMYYSYDIICAKPYCKVMEFMNGCVSEDIFPAWSLHRLWKLLPCEIPFDGGGYNKHIAFDALFYLHDDGRGILGDEYNLYDSVISAIEWLIKEGYFNKDYLEV